MGEYIPKEGEVIPPKPSEFEVQSSVTTAMILAGIRALMEYESREQAGEEISKSDVVRAVYAAMRCQA